MSLGASEYRRGDRKIEKERERESLERWGTNEGSLLCSLMRIRNLYYHVINDEAVKIGNSGEIFLLLSPFIKVDRYNVFQNSHHGL